MASAGVPFQAQDQAEIGQLIQGMRASRKIRYRLKEYAISDGSGRKVESWSLNDWDFKKPGLATQARGLFTHSNNGFPQIAVRGYDKFFNVGEVPSTEWVNVKDNTCGPYELSVKENGCIIFIAGLDENTLLVTSKHATGHRNDDSANHALVGEQWIDRQLAALGKTRADLAKRLYEMNATAVAELCDDEFEEHVLRYKPEEAGLYLHGINLNLPSFVTYPSHLLHEFSDKWGFRKVQYVVMNDLDKVKKFLDGVAETGNYEGRDTEGFVIRCKASFNPGAPYRDWFFKYKFEEPYLMYRQWREVTRSIIAKKPPHFRKHKKITEEYIVYARHQLNKEPHLADDFNKNHGIIAMRDGFLQYKGMKGSDIIHSEEFADVNAPVTKDVVLVPIATIGCGKTTVALSLVRLFGWGHEQNDNVTVKKGKPQKFASICNASLYGNPVVIADRNNHQRREREQLINDMKRENPAVKFVALHWVHDRSNYNEIKQAMRSRVLARGDNHQTIQAGSKDQSFITGIMDGFMHRFEPCDVSRAPDDAFDLVIDLDVASDSIDNLSTVITKLHEHYPQLFQQPSDQDVEVAIDEALNGYKPDLKHEIKDSNRPATKSNNAHNAAQKNGSSAPKSPKIDYFGVFLPSMRVRAILDAIFRDLSPETAHFYEHLKTNNRIQSEFHVTLIHKSAAQTQHTYWRHLTLLLENMQSAAPLANATNGQPQPASPRDIVLGMARVHLERVVWDGRVMCIVAALPDANLNGFHSVNAAAHITVGTANSSIKPVESNALLQRLGQDPSGIGSVFMKGQVVLDGEVKGIPSR